MLMVDNTSIMAHHDAELEGGGDHLIGRRRRGRMAVGASDSERRRPYASASDTPSSRLWECCVASAERSDGVAKRHGRRAAEA